MRLGEGFGGDADFNGHQFLFIAHLLLTLMHCWKDKGILASVRLECQAF